MTKETRPAHADLSLELQESPASVLHLESASSAFAAALESTDPVLQDTATRLSLSTHNLLDAYGAWVEDMDNNENTQDLKDALYSLRRVTSRVEIEMAAVAAPELDEDALRPIPVPVHRSARQLN